MSTKSPRRFLFLLKITLALAGVVFFASLAATTYLVLYLERHKGLVEYAISNVLDREVRIDGDIRLQRSLVPALAAEGVAIANAEWAGDPYLAKAARAVVKLDLLPLLEHRVVISDLILENADIRLEAAADGRQNWRLGGGKGERQTQGFTWHIERLDAERPRVSYRTHTGAGRQLVAEHLTAAGLGTPQVKVDVRGTLKEVPVSLSALVDWDAARVRFTAFNAALGESDLEGEFSIPIAKDSGIDARLRSRLLDLNPFLPQSAAPGKPVGDLLNDEIPFDLLTGESGALTLDAERLLVGEFDLEHVRLDGRVDKGELKLSVERGEKKTGSRVEVRPQGAQWEVLLKHSGPLDVEWLASQAESDKRFPPVTVDTELRMKGRTLSALLGSASGHLFLEMGSGNMSSDMAAVVPLGDILFSLLDTLATAEKSKAVPQLECAVARLDVHDGIAESSKGLALRTDTMNVLGGGTLDLRTGEVDLEFKTAQRRLLNVNILGVADEFMRITGLLWEPQVDLNVQGLLTHGTAAVATGGATLVYNSLFKKLTATGNPCDVVRDAPAKPD